MKMLSTSVTITPWEADQLKIQLINPLKIERVPIFYNDECLMC